MLEVVLHILSVLGIIFLILLGLFIVLLLAAAFFPVSYRIRGSRDGKETSLAVNVWWLFGLLRASYSYPEPGYVVVKVLFFKIFDTASSGEENSDRQKKSNKKKISKNAKKENNIKLDPKGAPNPKDTKEENQKKENEKEEKASSSHNASEQAGPKKAEAEPEEAAHGSGIYKKIQKLKYTISSLCDKIREIWENISYYVELLQEEDTKLLFSHALLRTGRILKNIRPRQIKAKLLYGFESPDTTGYAYGVYCMLAPVLGPGMSVTPDFENCVFKGEASVRGHITLWVALVNGFKLLRDKKLKQFMNKMKKEKREAS